eukprot:INCI14403.1.p1 GENE.INCI14403.1~~INCI14403.1.p1  ORF type:complete len:392 (+),score=68.74 INCI14403.1:130-1305(+)
MPGDLRPAASGDDTPLISNLYAQPSHPANAAPSSRAASRLVPSSRSLVDRRGGGSAAASAAAAAAGVSSGSGRGSAVANDALNGAGRSSKLCCCGCGRWSSGAFRTVCRFMVNELSWWQKLLLAVLVVVGAALTVMLFKYHHAVFVWVQDSAVYLQGHKLQGFFILAVATFATAFPPIPGYSICCYVAGYTFGLEGFFPIYIAAIVGAFVCFVLFRYFLVDCMFKWVASNKQYGAVNRTIKRLGFRFLILIRFAPFPFAGFNCILAAIPAVQTWQFLVATMISEIKIIIEIYTGMYLEELTEARMHKLPLHWWTSVIFVISLALATYAMYDLYRKSQAELKRSDLLWEGDEQGDGDVGVFRSDSDSDIDDDNADLESDRSRNRLAVPRSEA